MNNDSISREYVEKIVIAEFVDLQDGTDEWRTYLNDTCESILSKVHNAPTVEPQEEEKPQGKWEEHEDALYCGGGYTLCTACEARFSFGAYHEVCDFKFCPECGAEMRKGGAE